MSVDMSVETPTWFSQAIATPKQIRSVNVDNCDIVYQSWGDPNKPGLLLVHGNGAHAGWWDFIAPSFIDRFYVAALNLSGMGDSGHRERYTPDLFVAEVMAVCADVGFATQPLLLGHSFGGRLAFHALKSHRGKIAGVIMADSPFHNDNHLKRFSTRRTAAKPNKIYPSFNQALARFRLSPAQPCDNNFIMRYIGERSIQQTSEGWTWKFDPKVWAEFDYLGFLSGRPERGDNILALIYGEDSILFSDGNLDYNRGLFNQLELPELIGIANAYHHLLLDQPLNFIAVINQLLTAHLKQSS